MKPHSLVRRLVAVVLLVELVSAIGAITVAFFYERYTQFNSLHIAMLGRANTLLGAVQDEEDPADNVLLDMEGLHLPEHDLYEVQESDDHILGQTPGWVPPKSIITDGARLAVKFTYKGQSYRGVRLDGLRVVDPGTTGVHHRIHVLYASPAKVAWTPVLHAVRFFSLTSTLLLVISGAATAILVRRSMRPLATLAGEAENISAQQWNFEPPAEVYAALELRPLATALRELLSRLQLSFAQQRQFVSDSAHELKTAVTVVKSSLQLLELRARSGTLVRSDLETCLLDCQRMEELVYRMLALARVEEGGEIPSSESNLPETSVDVGSGAAAAVASVTSFATFRGITLLCDAPTGLHTTVSPEDWQSLCTNLLHNAVQHSDSGSCVRLVLEETSAGIIRGLVKDEGEGIPPEALPHVFDRFYRSDSSRARSTGGSGLGLAICRAIVTRTGGRIWVESTPGIGTSVFFELPLLRVQQNVTSQQFTI